MVQWQRHIFPILRRIHKGLEPANHSATNLALYHSRSSLSQGQLQRQWSKGVPSISRPFDHRFQYQGISSSTQLLKNSSEETPVSSPLVPVSSFGSSQGQEQNTQAIAKADKVQAILKKIKQSPKKVNLVAALVRGMLVKDALLQLQVLVKRASKTVYQVIHSARANASHNHGLDADRLIVAEAFVGKGDFKKRVSIHGKGRSGIMHRPECRLTVVLREITPEEEAQIARLKVHNFKKLTKKEGRLVPHQLIETTPVWGRKNKSSSQNETTPVWDRKNKSSHHKTTRVWDKKETNLSHQNETTPVKGRKNKSIRRGRKNKSSRQNSSAAVA